MKPRRPSHIWPIAAAMPESSANATSRRRNALMRSNGLAGFANPGRSMSVPTNERVMGPSPCKGPGKHATHPSKVVIAKPLHLCTHCTGSPIGGLYLSQFLAIVSPLAAAGSRRYCHDWLMGSVGDAVWSAIWVNSPSARFPQNKCRPATATAITHAEGTSAVTSVIPGQSSTYLVHAARHSNPTATAATVQRAMNAASAHIGSGPTRHTVVRIAARTVTMRRIQCGGLHGLPGFIWLVFMIMDSNVPLRR